MVHAASSRKLGVFIFRVADIALVAQRSGLETQPVDVGYGQVTGRIAIKHSCAQKGEHGVSP